MRRRGKKIKYYTVKVYEREDGAIEANIPEFGSAYMFGAGKNINEALANLGRFMWIELAENANCANCYWWKQIPENLNLGKCNKLKGAKAKVLYDGQILWFEAKYTHKYFGCENFEPKGE